MATRDQQRAALAYKHVSAYVGDDDNVKKRAKKYATIVHKLPALLQTSGLCQALHFVASRTDTEQRSYIDHLAEQLSRVDPGIKAREDLLKKAREANLDGYLRLTDEAMACAAWYRRLVQSLLKIEMGEGDD
jgi:CRISPR-associated protein Cmr5